MCREKPALKRRGTKTESQEGGQREGMELEKGRDGERPTGRETENTGTR